MPLIIKLFWDICRLRAAPQDVPYSLVLLIFTLILNAAISTLQLMIQLTFLDSIGQTLLMLSLSVLFTYTVLKLRNFSSRFVQTTTALVSSMTIINVVVFPLVLLQYYVFEPAGSSVLVVLTSLIILTTIIVLNIWIVVITAHIFRHALEIPFLGGLVVTFAFVGVHVLAYMYLLRGAPP